MDRYAGEEKAAYPTICKGRYRVAKEDYYAIEEPSSLNALVLLPDLLRVGVHAIKPDEGFCKINDELVSLWRAVDQ